MKKNEVKTLKKLRLSRETLRDLKSSDAEKVVGGTIIIAQSCPTRCGTSPEPEPCEVVA